MARQQLLARDLLERADKRVERPARQRAFDVEGGEGGGDGGGGAGVGFERPVGEVDGEVGGDGVEGAGGDDDGVGFCGDGVESG